MKNIRNAFSTIELVVVLIIISLLIVGISSSTNLIKKAELKSFMSELKNYQNAFNSYYTATRELPGTSNESLQISFNNSPIAWQNMTDEGVIDINLENTSSINDDEKFNHRNSPTSKLRNGYYAIGYNKNIGNNAIFVISQNETPYILSKASPVLNAVISKNSVNTPLISEEDAKFIDVKIDDGKSSSGKIIAIGSKNAICYYDKLHINQKTKKTCIISLSLEI